LRVGWRNRDKDEQTAAQLPEVQAAPSNAADGAIDRPEMSPPPNPEMRQPPEPEMRQPPQPGAAEAASPEVSLEANRTAEAQAAAERIPPSDHQREAIREQLERLTSQIHALQAQLDAFIARHNEPVAERASQQVASIVAAAEQSAAEIKASAERDAGAIRERLIAEAQAEVERIRSEAYADAVRIRTEAHAEAARAREKVIVGASAEIHAVCERLADQLQAAARTAISQIAVRPAEGAPAPIAGATPAPEAEFGAEEPPGRSRTITEEVEEAVDELQTAAAVLEQSLRHLRAVGDKEQTE
jgi:archaellum component FlaC